MAGAMMGIGVGGGLTQNMGNLFQQPPSGAPVGIGAAPAAPTTPPPLPGSPPVYVALNGQQAGPFDMAALQGLVANGQLTRDTLVWQAGMAQWAKAGEQAALAALFAGMPPPLPPQ
jgi:hypothetical protein